MAPLAVAARAGAAAGGGEAAISAGRPYGGDGKTAAAETSRWLAHAASWGYVSVHDAPLATAAAVLSIADGDQGELFFYIADFDSGASGVSEWNASLTLSQAGLNATTGCEALSLDPEDPRCAKATYSGVMRKACCGAQTKGKAALFRRHPAMASWPEGHNFQVYELAVSDVWIIDGYGGAATFTGKEYYAAKPRHNVVADGATHGEATGLPVLYLPTPDLTAVDVRADPRVTISLSEAALPERVAGGQVCGGADPEDPTCARLHLRGSLRALDGDEKADAERALGARHPHAPWLGKGGAHTGGKYYTIELSSIEFLDFYGGFADLSKGQASERVAQSSASDRREGVCGR
eukprot:PRCOL_00002387-RA